MQEQRSSSDSLLWTLVVLLGCGVIGVAVWLAGEPIRRRQPTTHPGAAIPSGATVRILDIPIPSVTMPPRVSFDDAKTNGMTNQEALDWRQLRLSNYGGEQTLNVSAIASITTITPPGGR